MIGPDGQPVGGARVVPSVVHQIPVPSTLGEKFAGTTDHQGKVTITGLARSVLDEVRIEAPGLGIQRVAVSRERFSHRYGLPRSAVSSAG